MFTVKRPMAILCYGGSFRFDCDTRLEPTTSDPNEREFPVAVMFGEWEMVDSSGQYSVVVKREGRKGSEYSAKQVFDGAADGFITVLRFDKRARASKPLSHSGGRVQ